jgi:hypothetical protein
MVKFWVTFALIVAALGVLSECDAIAFRNPFGFDFGFSGAGGERGSGVTRSETREVGAFSRIHVEGSGSLDIDVKPGNRGGTVEISGDDNLLPVYRTEVVAGVLEVSHLGSISPSSRLRIRVAMPALDGIHVEGANRVDLSIDSAKPLELHLEGAGRVRASGKVGPLTIHSEGAGAVDASELVAPEVDVTIEGAGKARVHATDTLKGRIEGAGTIAYAGNPKTVEKDIQGIGRISAIDAR